METLVKVSLTWADDFFTTVHGFKKWCSVAISSEASVLAVTLARFCWDPVWVTLTSLRAIRERTITSQIA